MALGSRGSVSALSSYFADAVYALSNCLSCFPSSPQLKINGRSFKIQRLLGEGGFSYVYLVSDNSSSQLLALKKIRCPFGQESVAQALKEVEAYALFAPHSNIIAALDHSIASDRTDPGAKTVYILLPYYRRGNLQDMINANLVNRQKFDERRLMVLVLGVCRALKAMHQYRVKGGPGGSNGLEAAKRVRREAVEADLDAAADFVGQDSIGEDDDNDEEEEGSGVAANSSRRRKSRRANMQAGDTEAEQPLMEDEVTMSQEGTRSGDIRAYAHRDIKPGNIMIADDGNTPILMDLGSLAPSPTPITSRSLALAVQDEAAEHSTMPYRAPELFDVKTDSIIDTKVDIWSLGCTIYACLVGKSPFEARSEETGGSLTMCVLGGDWRFPDEGPGAQSHERGKGKLSDVAPAGVDEDMRLGDGVKDVVRRCLAIEPAERPDVDELIVMVENVIAGLPAEASS